MSRIKTISEFSIYTALAFIFGYIESLIPMPVPFPGMKLGLANLIVVIVLYKKNFRAAITLSFLRIFLTAFTFGNLFSLAYSLAGSTLSILTMGLLKQIHTKNKESFLSPVSVSAIGGIMHNIGQLITAILLVKTGSIIWYFPVLYFTGLFTGLLIGLVSTNCLKRLHFLTF